EGIFEETVKRIERAVAEGPTRTIGLTGGSTPTAFYDWVSENPPFSDKVLKRARWFTSDERIVPLESEESNFGVAARRMLDPLGVEARNRFPWPVSVDP